jgi:hypothetical protein
MAMSDGWAPLGPLFAVALAGALGLLFWLLGRYWIRQAEDPFRDLSGLAIFAEPDDYGLLCPAAWTEEPEEAEEIQLLLAEAGIRATRAVRRDGRCAVLVFPEELEAARRLVL